MLNPTLPMATSPPLRQQVESFVHQLRADLKSPRWDLHGHAEVDDDYFIALEYCANRLDSILGGAQ